MHIYHNDYLWWYFDIIITFFFEFSIYSFFWHIGIEDVDRSIGNDVETIKGTRKLHSVKTKLSTNVFSLDKRKYSCFFHVFINNRESNDVCEKKMYVKYWKHAELNTKGKMSVAMSEEMKSEETTISSDGDRVSDLVREGNISISFKW